MSTAKFIQTIAFFTNLYRLNTFNNVINTNVGCDPICAQRIQGSGADKSAYFPT